MKKNTTLLFILVALGGLLWYMNSSQTKTTLSEDDWHIAIKDTDQIGHIFFANKNNYKIDLKRKNGSWIVNDKYPANLNSVNNLLTTLERMELRYRPQAAAKENMINAIASTGIKVEVYDLEDKMMKTFYIGDATNDERGVVMIMEGSENPYVMHIPTLEGNLRARFFLLEEKWRDKTIFKEDPSNIKSVSINYPKQPENSFVLNLKTEKDYSVSRLTDSKLGKSKHALKKGMGSVFLNAFTNQVAEAFQSDQKYRDSLAHVKPFCEIQLIRKDGSSKNMKLFPINKKGGVDKEGNVMPAPELDRYFANIDDEFYLVQNSLIKKMLWGYDYFFEE